MDDYDDVQCEEAYPDDYDPHREWLLEAEREANRQQQQAALSRNASIPLAPLTPSEFPADIC